MLNRTYGIYRLYNGKPDDSIAECTSLLEAEYIADLYNRESGTAKPIAHVTVLDWKPNTYRELLYDVRLLTSEDREAWEAYIGR